MNYYIYGLSSSKDNIIRYVGQTRLSLKQRFYSHKHDALKKNSKNHKCNWIRSVYNDGYEVEIKLIEITDEFHWAEREIFWINTLAKSNNLVNQLSGGNSGGLGGKLQNYLSYEDAKEVIRKIKPRIKSQKDYHTRFKTSPELFISIPKHPDDVYKLRGSWINWGDYLSTGRIADQEKHKTIMTYDEAKHFLAKQHIKTITDYINLAKKNERLVTHPERVYKDEWKGWYYFIGNKLSRKEYNYETFLRYMRLFFKTPLSMYQYRKLHQKGVINQGLPFHPERSYQRKWEKIISDISNEYGLIDKVISKK